MVKRKFALTIRRRNALTGYLFLAPWLFGFFVFAVYPVIHSFIISVNSITFGLDGVVTYSPLGLEMYRRALNVDLNVRLFLLNDVRYIMVSLPVIVVFSFIIATILNGRYRLRAFFRVVFFLPVVIMTGGVILNLLGSVDNFRWHGDIVVFILLGSLPYPAVEAILFVLDNLVSFLWFSGVQILIFLAGLQKIDRSVYEAAEIDGAGKWESFWKITLPFMKLLIMVVAIYTVAEIANFAGTTNTADFFGFGGAANPGAIQANQTNQYIIQYTSAVSGAGGDPYSYAAAMSWLYFILIAAIMLLLFGIYKLFVRGDNA